MEKTSRVCVLGKKKLKSEGKIQRQEGMVIIDSKIAYNRKINKWTKAENNTILIYRKMTFKLWHSYTLKYYTMKVNSL